MISLLSPANIGRVVILLAVAVASSWLTRCAQVEFGSGDDPMKVSMIQRVMRPADIVEATEPETVIRYRAPDSTRNECFNAPLWLDSLTYRRSENAIRGTTDTRNMPAHTTKDSTVSQRLTQQLAGLPYVITPTTSGRPALSVTSQTATLSAIDPRSGAGLEYSYDIPQDDWKITAGGDLTAGTTFAHGRSTVALGHRTPVGWIHLGAGYGGVVTDEIHAGIIGKVGIRKTLYSW